MNRIKQNRKTKWYQGIYSPQKSNKVVRFKSKMELITAKALDSSDKVDRFIYEPIKIPYSIYHSGKKHRRYYIPDFYVLFKDGSREIWEVKPSNQAMLPINRKKWAAAKIYCDNKGIGFRVVTNRFLRDFVKI